MKIAIWGCGNPVLNIIPILQNYGIEIAYVKVDYQKNIDEMFVASLLKLGVNYSVDSYPGILLDMIFVINYNRIISEDVLANYLVVNYHVGLLPKWRGNSANGWGVINGCNYVGYTIHRVNKMLDDGPIYYQYRYPYVEGETYYNARISMDTDLRDKLPIVLMNILKAPEQYLSFPDEGFVYCSKFRPIDGLIKDWNIPTSELIRRYYVFSRPLGTGLKFYFKEELFEISALSTIDHFVVSKGIPGGVVYKNANSVWIKTEDTAIALNEIKDKCGKVISIESMFVIGQRL